MKSGGNGRPSSEGSRRTRNSGPDRIEREGRTGEGSKDVEPHRSLEHGDVFR